MFFITNCGGGSTTTGTSGSYTNATITHDGFDFSAGKMDTDYTKNDGETIGWANNSVYEIGYSYDSAVWFRASETDSSSLKIYIYESSATSLDDVTVVDSSKWINATDPYPALKVGKIYVTKARDGYVKFEVVSLDVPNWEALVNYKYSATTSF